MRNWYFLNNLDRSKDKPNKKRMFWLGICYGLHTNWSNT